MEYFRTELREAIPYSMSDTVMFLLSCFYNLGTFPDVSFLSMKVVSQKSQAYLIIF